MSLTIQSMPSRRCSPVTALHPCMLQWCVAIASRPSTCQSEHASQSAPSQHTYSSDFVSSERAWQVLLVCKDQERRAG